MILSTLQAILLSICGMAWQIAWSLVLGFVLSGLVQVTVPKARIRALLGGEGVRPVTLATIFGAVSSSCSFAAASMSKTIFRRGAGFIPSLAFLFASTNLVLELGLLLWILMGWQFALAEWLGGIVMTGIMSILIRLRYPARLIEAARIPRNGEIVVADEPEADDEPFWKKLRDPRTEAAVARVVASEWSMLQRDFCIGLVAAGALAVLIPADVWRHVFFIDASPGMRVVAGAVVGSAIAVLTFVCSIGNVPLAAVLWSSGLSFAGVLAFLYSDLIVIPLLRIYRSYYGTRMAAYIAAVFFVSMVSAAVCTDAAFSLLHAVPPVSEKPSVMRPMFSLNYTFYLNLVALAVVLRLAFVLRRDRLRNNEPEQMHCCH